MNTTDINEVLHAIGRRDHLPNLALSANGCTGVTLADGVSLYFEWNDDQQRLHLYSPLLERPDTGTSDVYRTLLRLNCLSDGPVISMHPEREDLYLQMAFTPESIRIDEIDRAIERLTVQRKAVRSQLRQLGHTL